MQKTGNRKGRAMTIPGGLAYSELIAMGITLLLSGILAKMIESKMIPMEKSGSGVMFLLFTSSFLSAAAASAKIKHRIMMVTFLSGILYWTILMGMTALIWRGSYGGVWETLITILLGSACSLALTFREKKTRGGKRK